MYSTYPVKDEHPPDKGVIVPHVSIKHFPASLEEKQREDLVAAVTKAVTDAFGCADGVVSIAIEPVPEALWNDTVYVPEIVNRRDLLSKIPNY